MTKFQRQVELQCSTCGSTQFSSESDTPGDHIVVTCVGCGRSLTRGELIQENAANIEAHKQKLLQDTQKKIADGLRKTLRNAFKNNKNIKFK